MSVKLQHVRDKAKTLRKQGYSLNELVKLLNVGKGTVYYWIRSLPKVAKKSKTQHSELSSAAIAAGNHSRQRAAKKRQEAYDLGYSTYAYYSTLPTFNDFVMLYLTEGDRKDRNVLAVTNTNPKLILLAQFWMTRLPKRIDARLNYWVQVYLDQDIYEVKKYWATTLHVSVDKINTVLMKSSGKLRKRNNRSLHGVMTVRVHDTQLKAQMYAWMDGYQDKLTADCQSGLLSSS